MSILSRLSALFHRSNQDFDIEAAHHIDLRAAHLAAQGHPPEAARRQAKLEFGALPRYREESRQSLGLRLLDEAYADLRYTLRGIRQSPGFTLTSVAVLALALAANIAFFTLYDNYVLKPLPINFPERNYDLTSVTTQGRRNNFWSMEEYEKLKVASQVAFDGLYSESTWQVPITTNTQATQAFVTGISGPYFQLHATAPPTLGQYLPAHPTHPELVLSHAGWRRHYNSDPNIIGRTIRIRQTLFTIIGVAPPTFTGTEAIVPDFWAHIRWNNALRANADQILAGANLSGILRAGVTPAHAAAVLNGAALHFPRDADRQLARLELTPRAAIFPPDEESQIAAAFLFAAFLLVLAIACANLANLHLARAKFRAQEIAIRLSLGAGRPRLLRQLLTESIVLALMGATLGLGLAYYGIDALQAYLFSAILPFGITTTTLTLSYRIFLATATVGIATGIVFGLLPALEATKQNLAAEARTRPHRKRNALIIAQVTASLVLLILAGVLVRNTQRLHGADPGFPLDQIINTNLEEPKPQDRNRIANLPNIAAASVMSRMPLYGWSPRSEALVDGRTEQLSINNADEHFLNLLNLKPIQGRNFTSAEAEQQANVALISAATARLLWPNQGNVLGKTIQLPGDSPRTIEVVGIIPDIIGGLYFQGLDRSAVYLPIAPGQPEAVNLMIRTKTQTGQTLNDLRQAFPESRPAPLRQTADLQRFPFQAAAAISGALGTLALVLTCIGLFGVVSYVVAHRTKEIGIRLALGAEPSRILKGILANASVQVLWGIAIALPITYTLSRLAASNVLKIQTFDPTIYAITPALLLAVTLASCFLPARRASRVDPMISLRHD